MPSRRDFDLPPDQWAKRPPGVAGAVDARHVTDVLPAERPQGQVRGAWRRAAARATEREGVISRTELVRCGVTTSQVSTALRTGRMFRRARAVYVLGHEFMTRRARLFVALLRAGEGAVLSDRSAASAWGLLPWEGPVTVTVPRQRRRKQGLVQHVRHLRARTDVTHRKGMPITNLVRTLADCAGTLPPTALEVLVAEADFKGVLHDDTVRAIRAAVAGRPGAKFLRRLLDDRDPALGQPKSWLEKRWARFARDWDLPPYVRGTHVDIGGMELRESDVVFAGRPLRIVELDAFSTHGRTKRAFTRDRRRDRRLLARGGLTMRVTEEDFTRHEAELAEDVFRFLGDDERADAIARGAWRPAARRSGSRRRRSRG